MWGCAAGQGIVFFLSSVLNRVYNFAQVCHKDKVQRKSVLQLAIWASCSYHVSRVVKSSQLPAKITAFLVSIGQLLRLVFFFMDGVF